MSEAVNEVSVQEEKSDLINKHKNRRYLRPNEILAYICVSYGAKNLSEFVSGNQQFFMLNFLRLKGSTYGTLSLIANIYDAVDDSISGVIVDRTRTRWGHLRPYLVVTLPLIVLSTLMMFSAPELSDSKRTVYALFSIILYGLSMSYYNCWGIMLYNITPNVNERNNLITTKEFCDLFVVLPSVVNIAVSVLPKINQNITMKSIYTGCALICVMLCVLASVFGFRNMRERVPLVSREEMNNTPIRKSLKELFKNKPMFVVIIASFVNNIKSVGGASESFFWLNNVGSLLYGTFSGLVTGAPNYFMTPLAPKIINKFGARNTAVVCGLFGGCAYLTLFLIGYAPFGERKVLNVAYLYIMLMICGLPNCVMRVCNAVIQGDVYDYMEWKSGMRNEALLSTVSGWFGKLGTSIMGLLSGWCFTWIGYEAAYDKFGNLTPISDQSVLNGIFAIFALAPSIARFGYGISHIFFSVHGKFKEQITSDLEQRRAERILAEGNSEDGK